MNYQGDKMKNKGKPMPKAPMKGPMGQPGMGKAVPKGRPAGVVIVPLKKTKK